MYTRRLAQKVQRGFTLVELMVALTVGVLVAGAAVAALIVARQGFRSTDSNTELRENARFAATLLEKVAIQAGFQNVSVDGFTPTNPPGLAGYNNTLLPTISGTSTSMPTFVSRSTGCTVTDTSCVNGSDVLMVSFWGSSTSAAGGLPADGAMINCAGIGEPKLATQAISIFHIARDSTTGEPTLACTYRDPTTLQYKTVPLVSGVESMQILYGVEDGINVVPSKPASGKDSVALGYWTAGQLNSPAGVQATNQWSYVRSIRIGLLLRGSVTDSVNKAAATYQVLAASGAAYSFTSNTNDTLPTLTVAADGRMRQQIVFTIHLRNQQY